MMVKCAPRRGEYIACYLEYRSDALSKDVNAVVATTKTKPNVQRVKWLPKYFNSATLCFVFGARDARGD